MKNSEENIVTSDLGSEVRPLRVAIIGAGPSGFYAAGHLLTQKSLHVVIDMFDRLPAPYGLVRYGVAPDHQKIKSVTKIFERTTANSQFHFYGNVNFGTDITRDDLHQIYDAVIYAVGAQSDRKLNIPGEELRGSLSATEFVAWYNGHPDYVNLDVNLNAENVVVVGVGNVAIDVTRILAKTVDELKTTDIADYALEKLSKSRVKNIFILSRRGPAQVKFTTPEIKELGELSDAEPVIDITQLELDPLSEQEIANNREIQRDIEIMREFASRPLQGKSRQIRPIFLASPIEIIDDGTGTVGAVRIEHNELRPTADGYLNAVGTGESYELSAGMILRSVGYKGRPLPDVPYDDRSGTINNIQGRVTDRATGTTVSGEYVVGWAKRGPTGVIGTNKPDAVESVNNLLEDLPNLPVAPQTDTNAIEKLLNERGVIYFTIEGWRILDQIETARGTDNSRPRVKFTNIADMLAAIGDTYVTS